MNPSIHVNHLGFLCAGRKCAVVHRPGSALEFVVEDLSLNTSSTLAGRETFGVVFRGRMRPEEHPDGPYGICDFSEFSRPGVYRLSLPEHPDALSFQFVIADGVYHRLPSAFLGFLHELRSGQHQTWLRGPTHLDDAVRSDTGQAIDATGGWYDAGDTRKWMAHSTLAAWGILELWERMGCGIFGVTGEALAEEVRWGLGIIPKLQDPETGMILEDIGGGGLSRMTSGRSWWYENHAGCCGDNADNRFTDNQPGSGDERTARVQYNPIAQYTSMAMLARGARTLRALGHHAPPGWEKCASRIQSWMALQSGDEFHQWTSVRSWQALAAMEMHLAGWADPSQAEEPVRWLIRSFDQSLAFWKFSSQSPEPYRGIVHSAQPVIALASYARWFEGSPLASESRLVLAESLERYVKVMVSTNPFQFMPFGCYREETVTPGDTYRRAPNGWLYRYCMPTNHPQKINHGLSGHWMNWACAMSMAGEVLPDPSATDLAWAQVHWLTGNNRVDVSFISGLGYNNPMPHSRFLGTIPGGFMNGFCGSPEDSPFVDLRRECQWASTEYWNTPLAYCLLALARLLPTSLSASRQLGLR